MTHDELILKFLAAQDLNESMFFKEPTLGARAGNLTAKPDVLSITKSWANYEVRAYEIKVKQADLKQDVKKLKFENYRPWSHRLYFVLGEGLDESILEPHPVGIIKLTKGGFQTKRSAPRVAAPVDMTKSWDLFHALNMGESRYFKPSKYEQITKAQEFLEIARHKKSWGQSFRITIEMLKRHVEEAKASDDAQNYDKIKKKFSADLKKLFKIEHWSDIVTAEDFVTSVFRAEMYNLNHRVSEKLEGLFEEMRKEDEKISKN